MCSKKVIPVILCGGSGTRLWPLSRMGFPKQFLCLAGTESLFQQAASRLMGIGNEQICLSAPYIVSNEEHRFLAAEQLREIGIECGAALLEPVGRNTAPAVTLAALAALDSGEDPILAVIPADQAINDQAAFSSAMRAAIKDAEMGAIVLLGIQPDRPETGYGYIKVHQSSAPSKSVERFVEKPSLEVAQEFLDEGGYFWNAGMFVFKASVWMAALEAFRPDIAKASRNAWEKKTTDGAFIRPGREEFSAIPAESVDYAVMEFCPGSQFDIRMVPLDAEWSDLGSWDSVWKYMPKDAAGNAFTGDITAINCSDNLVHATGRFVGLVGMRDVVVVETPDAVLIADKSQCQDVKHIVNSLSKSDREEHSTHRKVHRPWGWYDSVDQGARFKVKRIQVNPGSSLSLQKHHHRAEHWVVVKGTAQITNGDQSILLTENQSTYIPVGEVHRLANPGTTPLEIIEVQSGDYLGEDDIVRFDDNYGRCE